MSYHILAYASDMTGPGYSNRYEQEKIMSVAVGGLR